MLADPHVGERNPRSEDRQLLLDALMAAEEHLVITYTGQDERTNLERPPAVPVGELLDVIDATARLAHGPGRDQVLVHHCLQPFDPRNFASGALVPGLRWGFDRVVPGRGPGPRASAPGERPVPRRAAGAPRAGHGRCSTTSCASSAHPVRSFLRRRLAISLAEISDELADALPVELDPLEAWEVGDRMLSSMLAGVSGNTVIKAEIARGSLPPGVLGKPVAVGLYHRVAAILEQAQGLLSGPTEPEAFEVRVFLPDGRLLTGTLPAVRGDLLLATSYSRVAAKHRLASWVKLLAATATAPERALSAATVGRAPHNAPETAVTVARIAPLAADATRREAVALEQLAVLMDLYDRGMREPLPLPCASASAYARAATGGGDPVAAARTEWESGWSYPREDCDLEHQLVFGGQVTLEELMALAPGETEAGAGWTLAESSRFGRLARRLWQGLLDREEVTIR